MTELFADLPRSERPLRSLPESYVKTDWAPPSVLPSLKGVKRLAIDCETKDTELSDMGPGCRRPGNYIAGIAIGLDDGPRHYLPIRHEGGGNLPERLVLGWAREELGNFDGELVGAHLLYDLDWLATEGVHMKKVKRFLDIQNAEPLLDENRYQFGLEALSRDYLGEGKREELFDKISKAYKWKTARQLKQNLWKLPAGIVGEYAEGDVDLPLRILPLQLARLKDEDLLDLFDIESRLIPLLLAMRRRGVRVDVEAAGRLRESLIKRRAILLEELRRLAGPKAELTLPDTLGPALEAAGVPVGRTAKTRAYSVTKDLLEAYPNVPLAQVILEGRKINTIIGTFIDGHVFNHAINGRLHCEFNQLKRDEGGTIARFSSSNPNLQNVPSRDEELAPMVRGLFIPEDGELWERRDLSQIEYRFLVHYAVGPRSDEARERYHRDPKTSFHNLAGEFFGMTHLEGETYKRIKNTNFCKVYGGGVPKLASTFNCSIGEAMEFNNKYDNELPFVSKTFMEAEKLAERRGYIKTILHRRRRFPLWEPKGYGRRGVPLPREQAVAEYGLPLRRAKCRNALSGMLQGGAADFCKKAMVDVWESGVCDVLGPPLLTVHDELDDSVPQTEAGKEAAAESHRLLENAIKLRVPVYADVSRGENWGVCK